MKSAPVTCFTGSSQKKQLSRPGQEMLPAERPFGPGAAAFHEADEGRMHRGHALWLATLKWVSEGR